MSIKNRLLQWWLGVQPVFAVCLDCHGKRWKPVKGVASYRFATLMRGRVKGRWFTGAGTCIPCYTDGEWMNSHHKFPNRKKADNG